MQMMAYIATNDTCKKKKIHGYDVHKALFQSCEIHNLLVLSPDPRA